VPDPRLARLIDIIHTLPEAEATTRTGQHYAFEVRGKKFCYYTVDHHGDGRVAITKASAALQALVAADPRRYFLRPTLASRLSASTSTRNPSTGPKSPTASPPPTGWPRRRRWRRGSNPLNQ
jgi:hypothetical protein